MNARSGLLLIDMQCDYFAGGAFELDARQRERAVEAAALLLEAARASGAPVVHVRHETVGAFPSFLRAGTAGAAFHPSVRPVAGEAVVVKHAPSGFHQTNLAEVMAAASCKRWLVGGMIAWMCVDSTVRAGAEQGFSMVVVPELVASRALAWQGRELDAEATLAAALAPLSFFAGEADLAQARAWLSDGASSATSSGARV